MHGGNNHPYFPLGMPLSEKLVSVAQISCYSERTQVCSESGANVSKLTKTFSCLSSDAKASDAKALDPSDMLETRNSNTIKEECSHFPLPVYLLGKFSADGNNSFDGVQIARVVADCFGLGEPGAFSDESKILKPLSWKKFYGPSLPPSSMF